MRVRDLRGSGRRPTAQAAALTRPPAVYLSRYPWATFKVLGPRRPLPWLAAGACMAVVAASVTSPVWASGLGCGVLVLLVCAARATLSVSHADFDVDEIATLHAEVLVPFGRLTSRHAELLCGGVAFLVASGVRRGCPRSWEAAELALQAHGQLRCLVEVLWSGSAVDQAADLVAGIDAAVAVLERWASS